jgi:hypothetical protein
MGKNFTRNTIEHLLHVDSFLVLVEPLFRLPHKGEGKQTEPDGIWCDIFDDDGVAKLKEVLQMCICVLAW